MNASDRLELGGHVFQYWTRPKRHRGGSNEDAHLYAIDGRPVSRDAYEKALENATQKQTPKGRLNVQGLDEGGP